MSNAHLLPLGAGEASGEEFKIYQKSEERCTCCVEVFGEGADRIVLPGCGHAACCRGCLEQISLESEHPECPICRVKFDASDLRKSVQDVCNKKDVTKEEVAVAAAVAAAPPASVVARASAAVLGFLLENKGLILFFIFLAVGGLDLEYQLHITTIEYMGLALGLMWVNWVTPSSQD